MAHPKVEIPQDPHGKARYASAKKHAELAMKAGKSSEEVHAIFKKVMAFNPKTDLDKLPKDEAHARYRSAIIHAVKAHEAGKSNEYIHDLYKRILAGEAKPGTGPAHQGK